MSVNNIVVRCVVSCGEFMLFFILSSFVKESVWIISDQPKSNHNPPHRYYSYSIAVINYSYNMVVS